MDARSRWAATLLYPAGWLLFYQAFVFIGVFAFGEWDPKFGGPWGTVEFLQALGVVIVGAPVLSYGLAVTLRWRWFQTTALTRVWAVALLTLAGHLAFVAASVALLSQFDSLSPGSVFVQWPVVTGCAIAPFVFVLFLSRRSGTVLGAG